MVVALIASPRRLPTLELRIFPIQSRSWLRLSAASRPSGDPRFIST